MIGKRLMARKILAGSILGATLCVVIISGCSVDTRHADGRDSDRAMVSQGGPEPEGGDSEGEHSSTREGNESSGEYGPGGEEDSGANTLALDETFDTVRSGTRLILSYDAISNSFKGTVENTTDDVLDRVRIEVHLSNGTELGPTTPTDMAPGEVAAINLPATQASFTGWTAHAEVGGGGDGNESGDEHGGDRKSGDEHGNGGERRSGG